MKTYNYPLMTAVVLNATRTSSPMQLRNMFGFSIQIVFTATPTGTFKLQASSDPEEFYPGAPGPSNWSDVSNSSQAVSAAGNYMWNISDVMYNWVRLVYTDGSSGSSTATVTAVFNGKGL